MLKAVAVEPPSAYATSPRSPSSKFGSRSLASLFSISYLSLFTVLIEERKARVRLLIGAWIGWMIVCDLQAFWWSSARLYGSMMSASIADNNHSFGALQRVVIHWR